MKLSKKHDVDLGGDEPQNRTETEPQDSQRETAESSSSERTSLFCVDDKDILFGRGRGVNEHPGNQRMRRIMNKYRDQYHSSERGEKCLLVRRVYNELISGGTKFLRRIEGQEDGWEEVSVQVAVDKVGHCLRSAKYRPRVEPGFGKTGNGPRLACVRKSSPAVSGAIGAPQAGRSQAREEHTFGPQHLVGIRTTPVAGGLVVPFLHERMGMPASRPSPLSSLDGYLLELERQRLRSLLLLTPGSFSPFSPTLNGIASSGQLSLMMEQQERIRRSLSGLDHPSSETAELLKRYSAPK